MENSPLTASDVGNACVCFGVRKAARLVARRYDEAFRPLGVTSGQFSILSALLPDRTAALGTLAEDLGMERTTLSRNLRPLIDAALIETAHDPADRRVRGLKLTEAGQALLDRALVVWREMQQDSLRRLDQGGWSPLKAQLKALE